MRIAVSSALVEEGVLHVAALYVAIWLSFWSKITQPIPILHVLLDCLSEPSVYMLRLSRLVIFFVISERVVMFRWFVSKFSLMMCIVSEIGSRCICGGAELLIGENWDL